MNLNPFAQWQTGAPFIISCLLFLLAIVTLMISLADFASYQRNMETSGSWERELNYGRCVKNANYIKQAKRGLWLAWIWPLVLIYLVTRWVPKAFRTVHGLLRDAKEYQT